MNIQSNKNIVYVTDKNISYIQFKKLLEYPEVVHAYTVDKNVDFKTVSNHSKDKNFDIAINNCSYYNYSKQYGQYKCYLL